MIQVEKLNRKIGTHC